MELVFDVGMHDGDDTAYYLSKGCSVVAVEANPELCAHARERFGAEIGEGRLVIEEVAISTEAGTAAFYVTEGQNQFSALDPKVAGRSGLSIREISVQTITPLELFHRYGVPFYLKVDIEHADSACLDALHGLEEVPTYVSVEAHALDYLCRLWCAGYRRFKIVDQLTHNMGRHISNETPLLGSLRQTIEHYRARISQRLRSSRRAAGPSGPFGEDTPGAWEDLDTVAYEWLHLHTGHHRRGHLNPRSWYDLHAAHGPMENERA